MFTAMKSAVSPEVAIEYEAVQGRFVTEMTGVYTGFSFKIGLQVERFSTSTHMTFLSIRQGTI